MLEKLLHTIAGLIDHYVLLLAGLGGAVVYVLKKKLPFWAALISVFTSLLATIFLTPWAAMHFDIEKTFHPGVALTIGLLSNEVLQLVFRILDELEKNPRFIIDLIKAKFYKVPSVVEEQQEENKEES